MKGCEINVVAQGHMLIFKRARLEYKTSGRSACGFRHLHSASSAGSASGTHSPLRRLRGWWVESSCGCSREVSSVLISDELKRKFTVVDFLKSLEGTLSDGAVHAPAHGKMENNDMQGSGRRGRLVLGRPYSRYGLLST